MNFSIIPEPVKFNIKSDEIIFFLNSGISISCHDECEKACDNLLSYLSGVFEIEPNGTGIGHICFLIDISLNAEGYSIETDYDSLTIKAADGAGAFYAVQSLKQLLLQGNCELPRLEISDYPEYGYRGFMLDSARYFFEKEDVFRFLDIMALHKLNRFHWHLTDDQGWRIELYSKLLLAQVGGFRAYTNFNKKPHGGFYTKQDIEDIIKYAHDRFITVIPEIDMPGHVVSAIAAYPFLSCFERKLDVATHSGVHFDVLCVGKKSTFDFVYMVLDEVCEMFPDKIIHIGGDEVPTERWEHCHSCQKLMKEKGFKSEKELHSYFINTVAAYLEKKGFEVIMWNDEEKESKLSGSITKQYWNAQPIKRQGEKIINSSSKAYYFDLPYGYINLKQCYEFESMPEGFDKKTMLGVEACLWTEYVPDMKKAGYCLIPRLAAFCESAWVNSERKSYDDFVSKLPYYYKLIITASFGYATPGQAMPNIIRKLGYNLYFERRQLHWQGLHNIIDNRKVRKLAEKRREENG